MNGYFINDMRTLQSELKEGALLVWFTNVNDKFLPTISELRNGLHLDVVLKTPDGGVLKIQKRN